VKFKSHLIKIEPYPPGKTTEELKRELGIKGRIYKFNSNENPLGTPGSVVEVVKAWADKLHLYPEASYVELKSKIAKRFEVTSEEVIVGNGSDEVIEFLFKVFVEKQDFVVVSNPSFLMYQKFGELYQARVETVSLKNFAHDLEGISKVVKEKPVKLVFLDHPHNPTGSVIKRENWYQFLKEVPKDTLVVIDEAYGDFVVDEEVPSGVELFKRFDNVGVIRTFSKSYGIAGLRLGFGLFKKEIAEILDKVRQPFNVNLLAYRAGIALLEDEEFLNQTKEVIVKGREYLTKSFEDMGFRVLPSQANFIMVDFGKSADFVYEQLLKKGILIRPLKAYGFSSWMRISIGIPEENQVLVKAVEDILKDFV